MIAVNYVWPRFKSGVLNFVAFRYAQRQNWQRKVRTSACANGSADKSFGIC
jgi:hypothetical protein